MIQSIPFMQIRGGSSKGVYFNQSDLPSDVNSRNQLLLDIMGRDIKQIDGLGGAHPLTSKVGIISPSQQPETDVDYMFVQVVVGENRVDTTPNCGNILAGVGAFAIESKMVEITGDITNVRVHMVNSGNYCELIIQTPKGQIQYSGDVKIDGVPGTSAPVICNYLNIAGSATGSLLPTGKPMDEIDGIPITCIDNGMPVIVIRAKDIGKTGYESCDQLSSDSQFRQKLEQIRLSGGPIMNLGNVKEKVVPKMCLIAPPIKGGCISTRTFIPHTCHSAIGVLGAVSVASACILPGSVAEGMALVPKGNPKKMSVEHPSGEFSVELELDASGEVQKAGILRTARLLSKGNVFIDRGNNE